jgi:hypothetical protein
MTALTNRNYDCFNSTWTTQLRSRHYCHTQKIETQPESRVTSKMIPKAAPSLTIALPKVSDEQLT